MRACSLVIIATLAAASSSPALAKRAAPPVVKPLVLGGVSYVARHETVPARGTPRAFVATIEAHDPASGKLLWDVTVYQIAYKPGLETDVQDVWIASLAAQGPDVLATDERGQRYLLDVAARTVRKLP